MSRLGGWPLACQVDEVVVAVVVLIRVIEFAVHILQQGANMVLMISAAGVGLLWYFLGESKQRRAFLEAKKSLEVKMLIEEQSAEQVRWYTN